MQTLLDKSLSSFARTDLLQGPTPIQQAERLEQLLGLKAQGVGLFLKRDDHMLIGGGGNKLRKLEFHIGAALASGVDTVITIGGLQSNHARLTAAVCARLGIACELILTRSVPKAEVDYELNGNVLLDQLFGAEMSVFPAGTDSLAKAELRAAQLRDAGRNVMVLPTGAQRHWAVWVMRAAQWRSRSRKRNWASPSTRSWYPTAAPAPTPGSRPASNCWTEARLSSSLTRFYPTGTHQRPGPCN